MKPGASHNGAVLSCKTTQPCEFQRTFALGNFPPIETLLYPHPHPPNKERLSQRNLETAEAFLTVAFPKTSRPDALFSNTNNPSHLILVHRDSDKPPSLNQ